MKLKNSAKLLRIGRFPVDFRYNEKYTKNIITCVDTRMGGGFVKKAVAVVMLVLAMISAMFSGCAGKESVPLRICVDLGLTHAGASSVSSAVYDLIAPLESSGKISNIEVEYIPQEGSERESALKRLRVELMSGEGPDVFIMECVAGTHLYGGGTLFPMPEKAMEAGIFSAAGRLY
ncbi:MAG: hypothetical protein J6I98_07105 [Clostridia bacterium]|nr:hypothetical protein [Clostridia bacterium]